MHGINEVCEPAIRTRQVLKRLALGCVLCCGCFLVLASPSHSSPVLDQLPVSTASAWYNNSPLFLLERPRGSLSEVSGALRLIYQEAKRYLNIFIRLFHASPERQQQCKEAKWPEDFVSRCWGRRQTLPQTPSPLFSSTICPWSPAFETLLAQCPAFQYSVGGQVAGSTLLVDDLVLKRDTDHYSVKDEVVEDDDECTLFDQLYSIRLYRPDADGDDYPLLGESQEETMDGMSAASNFLKKTSPPRIRSLGVNGLLIIGFIVLLFIASLFITHPTPVAEVCRIFNPIANARALFVCHHAKRRQPFPFLDGIRVLLMSWVLLGHTFLYWAGNEPYLRIKNLFLTSVGDPKLYIIIAAMLAVDSFFFLSGLLFGHVSLLKLTCQMDDSNVIQTGAKRRDPPALSLSRAFKAANGALSIIISRYFRLVTISAVVLFVHFIVNSNLCPNSDSALRSGLASNYACEDHWQSIVFLYNNLYKGGFIMECFGWSWYTANDFQFCLVGAVLVALYKLNKAWFGLAWSLVLTYTCYKTAAVAYEYGLSVVLVNLGPSWFGTGDKVTRVSGMYPLHVQLDFFYVKPFVRIGPYLVGLLLGVLIADGQLRAFTRKLRYGSGRSAAVTSDGVSSTDSAVSTLKEANVNGGGMVSRCSTAPNTPRGPETTSSDTETAAAAATAQQCGEDRREVAAEDIDVKGGSSNNSSRRCSECSSVSTTSSRRCSESSISTCSTTDRSNVVNEGAVPHHNIPKVEISGCEGPLRRLAAEDAGGCSSQIWSPRLLTANMQPDELELPCGLLKVMKARRCLRLLAPGISLVIALLWIEANSEILGVWNVVADVMFMSYTRLAWGVVSACILLLLYFAPDMDEAKQKKIPIGMSTRARALFSSPYWLPLTRISFLNFLIHPAIMLMVYGNHRPSEFAFWRLFLCFIGFAVVTSSISAAFWILVERPLGALLTVATSGVAIKLKAMQR